ncbi:hypothetical protein JXQ70_20795 [bacterium]|nr:hypothetical protein [bacterium]
MKSYEKTYIIIIIAIVLEAFSPLPFILTFGSLYILLRKPAWFLEFVQVHYQSDHHEQKE